MAGEGGGEKGRVVRTGAPMHTVGPQELFDQSGFHVAHSEAERSVQSTGSGTAMAMVPIPPPRAAWRDREAP